MYELVPRAVGVGDLGFSLKPPKWLRNIVGSAVKGTTVTVGGRSYDLGNPADVADLKRLVTGAKVSATVGSRPNAFEQFGAAVSEGIPGGWITVAALGLVAFLVLPRLTGGRRR